MSTITIPLPATVEPHRNGWFRVVSAKDEFVSTAPNKETADQIALALNLHDELVKCLRFSHNALLRASVALPPHCNNPASCAFTVDSAIQKNETVLTRAEHPTDI